MTTTTPTTKATEARPGDPQIRVAPTSTGWSGSRRRWMAIPVIAVLGIGAYLVVGAIGGSSSWIDSSTFVVTRRDFPVMLREKGELKAANSVDVKCEVEGRSTIIWLIDEGTEVKEGDLLVKLASDQIEEKVRSEEIKYTNTAASFAAAKKEYEILIDQNASDLRKAELALEMAGIELEKYMEGDWKQTQLDMSLELKRAEKVLARARADLADAQELHAQKFITKGELVKAEFDEFQAAIDVKKAELRQKIELEYTHPKNRKQKESDVAEAEKERDRIRKNAAAKEAKSAAAREAKGAEAGLTKDRLDKFREQQAKCEIHAPQAGMVVFDTGRNRWDQHQIAEGAEVYERQTIINLPDTSVMVVKVRIHEAKTDRIAIGQEARVEVEGMPGQVFTGKVTKIAVLADSQNQWLNPELKEYETEITLDETDAPLKPGVTARADIIVRQVENVLAVPLQSVFTKGGKHFVFRRKRGVDDPAEVKPGISNDEYVEIGSGLSEGDEVLLAVTDDLRRKLPEVEPNAASPNASGKDRKRGRRPTKGNRSKRSAHGKAGGA